MNRRLFPIVIASAALAVGCGGSDDDSATETNDSTAATTSEETAATDASTDPETDPTTDPATDPGTDADAGDAATELPTFASDFDRVCTTQVGFGGAADLSDGPGPRPIVLLQESDSGFLIESAVDLPAGWAVETDSDFEDNSDLAPTELVGCAQISATAPTGVECELELDDGSVTTLELVDVTYELNVYAAASGELVGTETVVADDGECPFFVFIDDGQTQYYNAPDADQYTSALAAYVTPS